MQTLWNLVRDIRVLSLLVMVVVGAGLYFGEQTVKAALLWLAVLAVTGLLAWLLFHLVRKHHGMLGRKLAELIATPRASQGQRRQADGYALRRAMQAAISRLRTSKLGITRGSAALYELPWYVLIGNPAAGKSSAILYSGLQFPYADNKVVHGVGGTRNCDWFFTTDGILLDTAGRYAVHEQDRGEWHAFLHLLKRYRARAPINGIIIAASVAELSHTDPEATIALARDLRARVQEVTERLEVFAPVYVLFTKADLIGGFGDFFGHSDPVERQRIWGATKRFGFRSNEQSALAFFDERFDELCAGIREIGVASLAQHRGEARRDGMFTFPAELAAMKAPMRSFIATLFEENSFQFRPI
ncbi:MAG TPA: type VI secretion protein IcmF/TssM N-terminal domain-containing protein, partial [Burkholderiaceae bacterium]